MKYPSLILILCEGKTEKLYFDSLITNMHIKRVEIEIFENQGQHKALIDKCAEMREKYSIELEENEESIEVWAVCDHDEMSKNNKKLTYQKLLAYAKENNVNLAFSEPQFETYLIQHFGCRKIRKSKKELEEYLNGYVLECYNTEYSKSNLKWVDKMIDETPHKIYEAIKNANNFSNHTVKPFLTVQKLAKRLIDLAP